MSTLINLRTLVRNTYLKIDPNAKIWDNNVLDYYINRWYSKVQKDFDFEIQECQTKVTIPTIWWVEEYDKPCDLVSITGFFNNQTKLSKTNKQDIMRISSDNSEPIKYYQYWDKIGFFPIPDTTYNLELLYNKKLPKITSTVWSLLDDDMNDLLVLWSCYLMFLSVEKSDKANMCLNQYTIAKDWMFGEKFYDDDFTFGIE